MLPVEMIEQFCVDKDKLKKRYLSKQFWNKQEKGAYLLFRFLEQIEGRRRIAGLRCLKTILACILFASEIKKLVPLSEYYIPLLD